MIEQAGGLRKLAGYPACFFHHPEGRLKRAWDTPSLEIVGEGRISTGVCIFVHVRSTTLISCVNKQAKSSEPIKTWYVTGAKRVKTGAVTSLLEKKLHNARARNCVLFKRIQNRSKKKKTFTILLCNETVLSKNSYFETWHTLWPRSGT